MMSALIFTLVLGLISWILRAWIADWRSARENKRQKKLFIQQQEMLNAATNYRDRKSDIINQLHDGKF